MDEKQDNENVEKEETLTDEQVERKEQIEETPSIEDKVKELTEKCDKYYNNWLKAEAELDNFKKRVQKEREEFRKFAIENFAKDVLTPIDYLEMAIAHAKNTQNIEALVQGVEYTHKCLVDILKNYDIEPVSSEGLQFDPAVHEAHEVQETDEFKEGTIIKEHRKAYKICGRLLRAAIVTVAKAPEAKIDKGESEENKEE